MGSLYSIGHSTRSLEEFLQLLKTYGIERVADIRRFPGSRRYPHFSSEALASSLAEHDIAYIHLPSLGGRRKPLQDSENSGMRSEQFRGYADHMNTDEFRAGVATLLGSDRRTAFMCAEAVPWRCHRNLLSDDLFRRGIEVIHIIDEKKSQPHALSAHGRVVGDRVVYAKGDQGKMF